MCYLKERLKHVETKEVVSKTLNDVTGILKSHSKHAQMGRKSSNNDENIQTLGFLLLLLDLLCLHLLGKRDNAQQPEKGPGKRMSDELDLMDASHGFFQFHPASTDVP